MRAQSLQVLACPECRLQFTRDSRPFEAINHGALRCAGGHSFGIENDIALLVTESDRSRVRAFADSYERTWVQDGWGSSDPDYLLNLPRRDITRRCTVEWAVKARSMDALFCGLDAEKWPRAVDLGCGIGWLSHHLAARGHEVFAVDVVLGDNLGLGAASTYVRAGPPFERVWAEMDHLPFASSSIDLMVCNASLHYARELPRTLREVGRVLRFGGLLAILNSPVHDDVRSAGRGQWDFRKHLRDLGANGDVVSTYHHFVRSELESSVHDAIGPVARIDFDPGRWFRWSRRLKGIGLRMELASFPILTATKCR